MTMTTKYTNADHCDQEGDIAGVDTEIKQEILKKLADYDWIETIKLKCRTYIENNGIKSTTADEIRDYLADEGLRRFPKVLFGEMEDYIDDRVNEIFNKLMLKESLAEKPSKEE